MSLTDNEWWIQQLQGTSPIAQKAWEAYKRQADKKCAKSKEFKVGDRVYLSTKYIQSTQPFKKLGPKYTGPFSISKIINPVTVQSELPKKPEETPPCLSL